MGSIHINTKKQKLLETVLRLTSNYTKYWNKPYEIDTIVVKKVTNKNPHIRVQTKLFMF